MNEDIIIIIIIIIVIIIITIIIPQYIRAEMTSQAHHSLLRIQYTITRVRDIKYWPRMSADLAEAEEVWNLAAKQTSPSNELSNTKYSVADFC